MSRMRKLFADLREAVAGSQQDFTEGSLKRAIPMLAIPMVLEMLMESVFAVVDAFWVGKLGPDALATVGLTESLLTVMYAVAVGLSMATTATVARRIGEKDREGASRVAVQANLVAILVAAAIGIPGAIFASDLLRLMGASESVIAQGSGYAAIMLGGNVVILLLFMNNAALRGAGDAAVSMRVLWFANIINLILDPCLIFGLGPFPELGLTGAAVATTTGRGLAVALQMVVLLKGDGRLAVGWRHVQFNLAVMLKLLRLSVGGIGQNLIATASWVALVKIVAEFGSIALAAYTIAIRVVVFALLPSWGLSNAAATLVGQSLGAKKPERAERAVWITGFYNMAFLGTVAIFFIVFARPLVDLFTENPEVLALGARGLAIISYGFLFYAWGMVMAQAFNGAGDTTTPTWINLLSFWVCQVPVAYWLAHQAGWEALGAFTAVAVSYSLHAVIALLLFRRGKWKTREV
jgi:putative MATE family efflux protein